MVELPGSAVYIKKPQDTNSIVSCGEISVQEASVGSSLSGEQNFFDLHGDIVLPVTGQTTVVLAATVLLDVVLDRWVANDLDNHLGAFNLGLAQVKFAIGFHQKDLVEFELGTDFRLTMIELHNIARRNPILPRAVLYYRIHRTKLLNMLRN